MCVNINKLLFGRIEIDRFVPPKSQCFTVFTDTLTV